MIGWILAGVAALIVLGVIGLSALFFRRALTRPKHQPSIDLQAQSEQRQRYDEVAKASAEWLHAQPTETLTLRARDGIRLQATNFPAAAAGDRYVVLVHGYMGSADYDNARYAEFYHNLGYHVLLPDNRAHGASEGKYIGMGMLESSDIAAWCNYLVRTHGKNVRIALHGVSMGATAAMLAMTDDELPTQVLCVIEDCGFTSAWEQVCHVVRDMMHLPVFPFVYVADLICVLRAKYGFRQANAVRSVRESNLPLMIIHGGNDTFVPTEMADAIAAARPGTTAWIVPGAEHAASYLVAKDEYEKRVRMFLKKHLR